MDPVLRDHVLDGGFLLVLSGGYIVFVVPATQSVLQLGRLDDMHAPDADYETTMCLMPHGAAWILLGEVGIGEPSKFHSIPYMSGTGCYRFLPRILMI